MSLLHDDRELLEQFRAGKREALTRAYQGHVREVASFLRRGFVYRRDGAPASFAGITSPFELESTVQEVFARAFTERTRMSYDGLRPYGSFLCGIARNIMLDQLRKRARRKEVIEEPETFEQKHQIEERPVAEVIDARRAADLVSSFLESESDDRDRALYELRYARTLSQQAAADEAGLTRIQVRRWERKFKARLLRYLKRAKYVR